MIEKLNKAFCKLPGVGSKSAQRFIYHLLERDRQGGLELAKALTETMEKVKNCERCRTLSEKTLCSICANNARDGSQLCVVETPTDIHVIEQSGVYSGKYFVLSGYLSPIDGIGAAELGLDELENLLKNEDVNEIILATNSTAEGQITAQYIADKFINSKILITRLAQGMPMGGELDSIDNNTLFTAFNSRAEIDN